MKLHLIVALAFIISFFFTSIFALLKWDVATWIGTGFLIASFTAEAIIIAVGQYKHYKNKR